MIEEKLCPDCNARPLKYVNKRYTNRCIPCTMINDAKKRNAYHKKKKIFFDLKCPKCGKEFKQTHEKQKYCHSPCTKSKTQIELFLGRKDVRKKCTYRDFIFKRRSSNETC